jgi:hypothetical protein
MGTDAMFNGLRDTFSEYTPEQRSELAKRAALALLGLVIGLFIGWVVWPVERDAGTIESLRPDLKAQYLSAVADAYVASGGQNVESTLARLSGLSDPDIAIAEAIGYFQERDNADSAVHQINLRTLATAVQADESVVRSLQESSEDGAPLGLEEPEIGWLNWLLVALTAVLLTAGGLWIAMQLLRQRGQQPLPAGDSLVVDARHDATVQVDDADRDAHFDLYNSQDEAQRIAAWEAMIGPATPISADDLDDETVESQTFSIPEGQRDAAPSDVELDIDIEEEDEEEEDEEDGWEEEDFDQSVSAYPRSTPADSVGAEEEQAEDAGAPDRETGPKARQKAGEAAEPTDEEKTPSKDANRGEERARSGDAMVLTPAADRTTPASPPEQPAQTPDQAEMAEAKSFQSPAPPLPGPAMPRTQPGLLGQAASKKPTKTTKKTDEGGLVGTMQGMIGSIWPKESSESRQAAVGEFTARYHYSISDYDESFVITGANADERLGACGMGTQKDLDPRAASRDRVQVLDVWFYDRADFRTHNQLLVSPAVDWATLDGKVENSGTVTGDPLVAEPGVTFKLQGKDLVLECQVEAVEYLEQKDDYAPFGYVSVVMTVRRKR